MNGRRRYDVSRNDFVAVINFWLEFSAFKAIFKLRRLIIF